jgi:hypothetical protein
MSKDIEKEIKPVETDKKKLLMYHAALRTTGIDINIPTLAVILKVIETVNEKGESFSLADSTQIMKELNDDPLMKQLKSMNKQ